MEIYTLVIDDFFEKEPHLKTGWIKHGVTEKLTHIANLSDPRKEGGAYRKYWGYTYAKIVILCEIDDDKKTIIPRKIIKLD